MDLGAFSVSLAVKDIEASKVFYEKLGFSAFGGDPSQHKNPVEESERIPARGHFPWRTGDGPAGRGRVRDRAPGG